MEASLKGQVAVVTGASGGRGEPFAGLRFLTSAFSLGSATQPHPALRLAVALSRPSKRRTTLMDRHAHLAARHLSRVACR